MAIAWSLSVPVDGTTDHGAATSDVAALLPGRAAVLARLAEQLPSTGSSPANLLVVALLAGDEGRLPQDATLSEATTLLARSLRGDDWLASSAPAQFVAVLCGPAVGARVAANRVICALGARGISAAGGIAPLSPELTPDEALRRATVSLTAARRVGPGTVVQHRLPY